jgi:hypothetical protein
MNVESATRVSRRKLIRRLGMGTAVAWLTPIVTTLGSRAEAGCVQCSTPDPENGECGWSCGGTLYQCGQGCGPLGDAYCSHDVDGNCYCWENSFCDQLLTCDQNSDCPAGYACVPDTCCGVPSCFPPCGMGRRPRHRHGLLANGQIR